VGANPLTAVFFYLSLVILASFLYRLLALRPNPFIRIFSAIDIAFDIKAFLSLSIFLFTFLAVRTSFNPTLSLLNLVYNSVRLEYYEQTLNPVVEFHPTLGPSPVMGEASAEEDESAAESHPQSCKGNFIKIEKIGVSAPIVEGEDDGALERGVWRLPESAKPGTIGNAILTGHRWTLVEQPYGDIFYHLPDISSGDQFTICYGGKTLRYKIFKTGVVEVGEMDSFSPSKVGKFVTLYTCHPLWTAEKRFVAIAEEI